MVNKLSVFKSLKLLFVYVCFLDVCRSYSYRHADKFEIYTALIVSQKLEMIKKEKIFQNTLHLKTLNVQKGDSVNGRL